MWTECVRCHEEIEEEDAVEKMPGPMCESCAKDYERRLMAGLGITIDSFGKPCQTTYGALAGGRSDRFPKLIPDSP